MGGIAMSNEIDTLGKILEDKVNPKRIYLFGSFAKGTNTEDSDIDFYLVMPGNNTGNQFEVIQNAYKAIRRKRVRPVDIVVGYEEEFEMKSKLPTLEKEVAETGVIIYERK